MKLTTRRLGIIAAVLARVNDWHDTRGAMGAPTHTRARDLAFARYIASNRDNADDAVAIVQAVLCGLVAPPAHFVASEWADAGDVETSEQAAE